MGDSRPLMSAAIVLAAVQVLHAGVPGPGEGGSRLGPVAGLILLSTSVAAVFGARAGRTWARPLLFWTGIGVAVGFFAYHALPFKTPLSYPYWGSTTANVGQWLPVIGAIAAGAWSAWVARPNVSQIGTAS